MAICVGMTLMRVAYMCDVIGPATVAAGTGPSGCIFYSIVLTLITVVDVDRFFPVENNGLQSLCTHDGSEARPGGHPPPVITNASDQRKLFPGGTDQGYPGLLPVSFISRSSASTASTPHKCDASLSSAPAVQDI